MPTCADCGFLGVFLKGNANYPGDVITAQEQFRKAGGVVGGVALVWGRPVCIRRELDFSELLEPQPHWSDLGPLLQEDRPQCKGYYPWIPGFRAQDHMQMKVAEQREAFENEIRRKRDELDQALQQRQLEFEAAQEGRQTQREDARDEAMRAREDARDAALREREDARDEEARKRHGEQMNTLRANHRRELAVFGGALIIATLVAGAIQAGWMPEPGWMQHPGSWWPFQ